MTPLQQTTTIINDENRELLRRAVQNARRHLDAVEVALISDTPATPTFDLVWKNLTTASIALRTGADLVGSLVLDEHMKEHA